jgi:hypothetical protein
MQAETGCLIADRRIGRIVELGRVATELVARVGSNLVGRLAAW